MNNLISYLESKDAIFHGALVLIILYVPHAGNLFMQLEHLDMTWFEYVPGYRTPAGTGTGMSFATWS